LINIIGGIWGREEDNIGIGVAYLDDSNTVGTGYTATFVAGSSGTLVTDIDAVLVDANWRYQ